MKEIKIKKLGYNNLDLLVEFYDSGIMIDYKIFTDTMEIQKEMANFLFGDYKIEHN